MKNINIWILFFSLISTFLSVFAEEVVVKEEPTLCKSNEKNIFSCATGEKVISLCAVITESKEKNILTYYFGKQNSTPELEYSSKEGEDINKYFQYAYYGYAKGTTHEVSFKKGKYTYTIAQERHAYATNGSGVIVEKDYQKVAELKCNNSAPDSNFNDLKLRGNDFEFEMHDPKYFFSIDH
jgi:hypothetical protein